MKDMQVRFFLGEDVTQFASRRMPAVPRVGDFCVFQGTRHRVERVEWLIGENTLNYGLRVEVELARGVKVES